MFFALYNIYFMSWLCNVVAKIICSVKRYINNNFQNVLQILDGTMQKQKCLKLLFVLAASVLAVWLNLEELSPFFSLPPLPHLHVKHDYENNVMSNRTDKKTLLPHLHVKHDHVNSVMSDRRENKTLKILYLSASTSEKKMKNKSISDKCIIMHNQIRLYNISDVVIFSGGGLAEAFFSYRPPGQIWMFRGWEAAYRDKSNMKRSRKFQNIFNYTMTYSIRADFYLPYGKCEEMKLSPVTVSKQIDDIVKNKTKLVSWLVGHCGTSSMRENYVRELMQHIPVDVYGDCGNNTICPRASTCKVGDFLQKYKFYLAFENTLNGEYITEKLWRTLSIGLVPIVYGALETYRTILPNGSYIDVEDFSSPQELAKYIFKVNSNDTLYRSFFSWKYRYICYQTSIRTHQSALCDFLISAGKKRSVKPEVWEYPATRSEDAPLYLQALGVSDITKHNFRLKKI